MFFLFVKRLRYLQHLLRYEFIMKLSPSVAFSLLLSTVHFIDLFFIGGTESSPLSDPPLVLFVLRLHRQFVVLGEERAPIMHHTVVIVRCASRVDQRGGELVEVEFRFFLDILQQNCDVTITIRTALLVE